MEHFFRIINSPSGVIGNIKIMLGSIIKPSLPTWQYVPLFKLLSLFFSSLDFFEIGSMLLFVNVVGEFVVAEICSDSKCEN
jgi:hypothetical protein